MNVVSDVYWLNNREACVRSAEEATLEATSQTHPESKLHPATVNWIELFVRKVGGWCNQR